MNRISLFSALAALCACVSSDQLRRQQYDADYQRAVQQCGHPDMAFQTGYNQGYAGERMRNDWTAMCVPEVRAQTAAAYQDGFLKGAQAAPIQVVHTVRPVGTPARTRTTTVAECTFDSDCGGDGYHCRERTCMGYGLIGDRCVFNDDCTTDHCFGGTCRE
jgi:hypothetical protein